MWKTTGWSVMQVVCLALVFISLVADGLAAPLEARLDRNRVADGEAVVLTLRVSGEISGTPDFSPLVADFDLLNQGQSSRMQFINGRSSSWREWHLTLAPKRLGTLRIPPLQVGSARSDAIELEVLPAAEMASNGPPPPVRLVVEATPEKAYVQGKVVYRVRVLTRAPLRQLSLTEPIAANAIIERLGPERHSDTYRDGQNYRVSERRYAIFPQRSGQLEIDPPILTAQLPDQGNKTNSLRDRFFGGRDPFADLGGVFSQARPIRLRAQRLTVDVQPQPAGTPTPWLPAESVSLDEAWSPNPPVFRVGEPVTRSIAITAQGVTGAQLPDLGQGQVDGINSYPDKPQVSTRADGDTLVAQKIVKTAIVPVQAGRLTLPAVELAWWDTANRQQRVARIPARTISVEPAAAGGVQPPGRKQPQRTAGDANTVPVPRQASAADPSAANDAAGEGSSDAGVWPWLAALFALAWLASLFLWWRARARTAVPSPAAPEVVGQRRGDSVVLLPKIEAACHSNDAKATRQLLLEWSALTWPDQATTRLEQLADRLPGAAAEPLRKLDRALYAAAGESWDGADAWQRLGPLLRAEIQRNPVPGGENPLPPLYPRGA